MRVGIEVGGTFTDLILVRDGAVSVAKVPSTPAEPDVGAINALDAAVIDLKDVTDLVHGSTVATNAVLERKGGRVGVLVTRGMRDVFALQRHDRTSIYDLNYRKPQPIVNRDQICELDERLGADGTVVLEPDTAELTKRIGLFIASAPFDAIAICLLNSYVDPVHERLVADIVCRVAPEIPVTCSCDVAPEFREYERASTTVLAAYVQPTIQRYLKRLIHSIDERGFAGSFSIMQSNGGRIPARTMARNAVSALYSGPAAGVVGAVGVANSLGYPDIITLDMGGTSTDVSLVVGGTPALSAQTRIDGLPVRTPVIDIATVGAGGGSIAWVDDGGLLRVGPESAGATPGPACYGRKGELPTVTDAHLIRGTLRSGSFLGGTMTVDIQAARRAYEKLAARLELAVDELADAAIRIAEANIVRAIQQVSTERGHDPRDFVLVPFGGAGGLHAARVAHELGIGTIVVPDNAGVLSALGLLVSDYVHYRTQTERLRLEEQALDKIQSILTALRRQAAAFLQEQGVHQATHDALIFETSLEMRYVGQAFEVSVPLDGDVQDLTIQRIANAFSDAHHKVFEFSKPPDKAVEIVTFRIGARARSGSLPAATVSPLQDGGNAAAQFVEITESGRRQRCRLVTRQQIGAEPMAGPLLVEDGTSTIYVPPQWMARTDQAKNLIMNSEA